MCKAQVQTYIYCNEISKCKHKKIEQGYTVIEH
jgi:hypothetical protein